MERVDEDGFLGGPISGQAMASTNTRGAHHGSEGIFEELSAGLDGECSQIAHAKSLFTT